MKKKWTSNLNGIVVKQRSSLRRTIVLIVLIILIALLTACSGKEIQESPDVDELEISPFVLEDTATSLPLSTLTPNDEVQTSTHEIDKDTPTASPSATTTATYTLTTTSTPTATALITCPAPEGYLWSRVFSEDTALITNLFPLEDGNVILSGSLDNFNGFWIAKIDQEGNPIWQNKYSSSLRDMIKTPNDSFLLKVQEGAIEINLDGEVVQSISITNMLPNADGSNTVLDGNRAMRYTDESSPLWAYSIGNPGLYGEPTSDGGVIYAYSGEYSDDSVYWRPTYTDIKVILIDVNGVVRQHVYGKLIGYETLDMLEVTDDGGALLAGTHYYEELGLDYDVWLMKINKSGGISWQTTLRFAETLDSIDSLYTLSQGYLLVNDNYINNNIRLVKLSSNGALVWQKEINSIRGNVIIDTAADTANGGLILFGHTAEKTEVRFLARFDTRGNLLWEKLLGFSGLDNTVKTTVNTILPLKDGNILLGGGTNLLGQGLSNAFGAWLTNIEDKGEVLGFLTIFPGKFSIISTLSTRPNTLPDEVVDSDPIRVTDIEPKVEEVAFQASPVCLSSGVTLPTPQALPTIIPSPTPTPSFVRDLYLFSPDYMRGDDVMTLQLRLLELGYNQVGDADGIFGKMTQEAVRSFQENNNLTVDGYVGPLTWNKLFSPSAQPND